MKIKTRMKRVNDAITSAVALCGNKEDLEKESIRMVQDLHGTPMNEDDATLAAQISRARENDSRRRYLVKDI